MFKVFGTSIHTIGECFRLLELRSPNNWRMSQMFRTSIPKQMANVSDFQNFDPHTVSESFRFLELRSPETVNVSCVQSFDPPGNNHNNRNNNDHNNNTNNTDKTDNNKNSHDDTTNTKDTHNSHNYAIAPSY